MALDKITTDIIADDAVTAAKIVAGAVDADIGDNAVTLAKMAGGTDGQIITYDASGDPVAVGPGTDGQVLTSTGAGSPPAFEDVAGGGWQLLHTVVISNSQPAIVGYDGGTKFTSDYDFYMFHVSDWRANNKQPQLQVVNTSGTAQTGSTDYEFHVQYSSSSSYTGTASGGTSQITLAHSMEDSSVPSSSGSHAGVQLQVYITNPLHTTYYKNINWIGGGTGEYGNLYSARGSGIYKGTAAVGGLLFKCTGDSNMAVTVRCYGLANS